MYVLFRYKNLETIPFVVILNKIDAWNSEINEKKSNIKIETLTFTATK